MADSAYELQQLTLENENGRFTVFAALTAEQTAALRAQPASFLWDDHAARVVYVVRGTEPTAEDTRIASAVFKQWRPGSAARYEQHLK